ncbi:MAG TPA: protein TolR [Oceanospirillales bacterium]|jgi:biopolymer transport protein TolR|nr:protein TolR [Oceanospirillales bacterium]|tara:strand:- start:2565 stop:3026 length:462 start_codon:yes stop_codon:yes gene_type:complete
MSGESPLVSPGGAKRKPMAEINVVPYIDVMLVLLIIFMVTAPMLNQGVDVDLPNVDASPVSVEEDENQLIVSVAANGLYYLERGSDDPKAMALVDIKQYVATLLKSQPKTDVLVRGDETVPYGVVVALMGALQNAGAESVGLITEAPDPQASL